MSAAEFLDVTPKTIVFLIGFDRLVEGFLMSVTLEQDIEFMTEALALAACGAGQTSPNPMVGCVLVRDGKIIGKGWHEAPGKAHAEVAAITDAGEAARGATAYVTLEPCNHTGRTGPCTEALIEAGVAEVVYALSDPNPIAAFGGERLTAAGIKVRSDVCTNEAQDLNRGWMHSVTHKRPYVIGKTAMSLDGRISTSSGESKWITSEASRKRAHQLRKFSDAIIVGAETVIADDPALTARNGEETKFPLRVIMDSTGRTPPGAKAYERTGKSALIITTKNAPHRMIEAYREIGAEPILLPPGADGRPEPVDVLETLHERGIVNILVEGGGAILGAFFDADLIDELHLFIAPKLIGGGKPAFGGHGIDQLQDSERFVFADAEQLGADRFLRAMRRRETS